MNLVANQIYSAHFRRIERERCKIERITEAKLYGTNAWNIVKENDEIVFQPQLSILNLIKPRAKPV